MSNDSGVIEHITIPSLSGASFASKRCTGSTLIIPARTSSIAGTVLWNTSEALSKKITDQRHGKSALPWNRRNWYLIAKHLAWRDYSQFQKRTQVHEDEHSFPVPSSMSRQERGPLRHVQSRGILPGIALQLQSQLDKQGRVQEIFIVPSDSGCHWITKLSRNASWKQGTREFVKNFTKISNW